MAQARQLGEAASGHAHPLSSKPDSCPKPYAMEKPVRDGVMEPASDDGALAPGLRNPVQVIQPARRGLGTADTDTLHGARPIGRLTATVTPRPAPAGLISRPVTEGDNKGEVPRCPPAGRQPDPQQADYTGHVRRPTYSPGSTGCPSRWILASEAAFPRAEGAMRGWTAEMGGDRRGVLQRRVSSCRSSKTV